MSIQQHLEPNHYNNVFSRLPPTISIVDQPKQRGLRFRYKCEGRSAGSIPGENSSSERKTYPSIRINNYDGPSAIVVVSCVTKDSPYLPHPHNLVGQDCRDGVCTVKVKNPHAEIPFPNIGIQCCKRHDIEENLKTREKIRVDPFGTGYPGSTGNIDLNAVRLCFQVFLPDNNKKFTKIVNPVVSNPIIDKKSVHDLVICRLSRQSGSVGGGDEVFLLCEKINKDDIRVRFYQDLPNGELWEAEGEFTPNDVHRQYAIVFKTPPYKDLDIQESTTVFIQLRRTNDESGDPKPFQYIPHDPDPFGLNMKKRKRMITSSFVTSSELPIIQNQIPRMVMDEYHKDDHEATDCSNGSSFAKYKLKKKIEKKITDTTIFNLNHQSLIQPTIEEVNSVNKVINFQQNSINQGPQQQPAKIIHFLNNFNNFNNNNQFINHNNILEKVDIKDILPTSQQLNNINNNKINNGNELINKYNNTNSNLYNNNSNNNIYNNDNSNRMIVGAHEIISSPTTTPVVRVVDVVTEMVADVTNGSGVGGNCGGEFKHEKMEQSIILMGEK